MKKRGITIAGNLIVDYVKVIDTYPDIGLLCNIQSTSRHVGGCAANTPSDLALLDSDLPIKCLGLVGDDENGQFLIDFLTDKGIDCSGIRKTSKFATSYTDVMSIQSSGARTFFHFKGANSAFGMEDINFDALETDFFHIGYALLLDSFDQSDSDYGTVMARTLAKIHEKGIRTSMDVVSEAGSGERFRKIVRPCLPYCDYIVINEIEASQTTGIRVRTDNGAIDQVRVKKVCSQMLDFGVNKMVVIHAPEGGWAMTRDGQFAFEPSFDLPDGYIAGTVGAGDAFCAGVLYGAYMGYSLQKALELANACAACNLSSANSTDGMKPVGEVLRICSQFKKRSI